MINEILNYLFKFFSAFLLGVAVAFGVYKAGKNEAKKENEIEDLENENKVLRSTLRLKKNEIKTVDAARDYINEQLHKNK